MGDIKWTKEQLEAINEKGCNLLVAAAAGAGKTAVLVERIIRKIACEENPVDIDKLLIVTFTNAAASEMRERIADAISKALDREPGSKLLQKQLSLLNKANITTIHSFCLDVIRNNFHCIGLNPVFKIADETEALLMKIESLDQLFENIYEGEPEDEFFELLECYGGSRSDQGLQDTVLTLYEFVQSCPWPEDWLMEKAEYFNLDPGKDFGQTLWGQILLKNVAEECKSLARMLERATQSIERSYGLSPYLETFQREAFEISRLGKQCYEGSWDSLYEAFNMFSFSRLARCKKDADKVTQEYVKTIRDEVKGKIRKIQEGTFTDLSEGITEDLYKVYPLIKYLTKLVIQFTQEYANKKKEKSILDFNDLEHFCLSIFTEKDERGKVLPSKIAEEYKEKFDEIFIDEYQDSNLVQEIILNVISKKDLDRPNMFMVGDVKQSIYRFRQARPELFLEKYNTYSDKQNEKYRKIQLYKNFRSRKEIIDSVNFLFGRIMSIEAGELDYTDKEKLNLGAVYSELDEDKNQNHKIVVGGATELHIVETEERKKEEGEEHVNDSYSNDDVDESTEEEESVEDANSMEFFFDNKEFFNNIQCEAKVVAKKIKELVNMGELEPDSSGEACAIHGIYDKSLKKYRRIDYRDITVLLRATKGWADVFIEEFTAQEIPVYADTGTGFFKTIEVQIILSLLQIIDNPLQDIPLLSVLRSPIFSFTADELTDIKVFALNFDKNRNVNRDKNEDANENNHIVKDKDRDRDGDKNRDLGKNAVDNTDKTTSTNIVKNGEKNIHKYHVDQDEHKDCECLVDYEDVLLCAGGESYLYEVLKRIVVEGEEQGFNKNLTSKIAGFIEKLNEWRDRALYTSTDELIWFLYTETGFYSYVGAMPGGEQRQANLRMLFEQARRFEETSYKGLFYFINFINKLRGSGSDMGSAKVLGENENVVRVMSIHKSKGLEFPVVILSGLGKGFNLQDLNRRLILHQELGFGPDYVDCEKRISYPTPVKQALKQKIKSESLSEEMRILYVGFTRAKEKLILTGSVKNLERSISNWKNSTPLDDGRISGHTILAGKNYLDWICPVLIESIEHRFTTNNNTNEGLAKTAKQKKENVVEGMNIWNIKIWNKENAIGAFDIKTDNGQGFPENKSEEDYSEYHEEINRRLNWEYKYIDASRIPVKISVTELKRRYAFESSEEHFIYPAYSPPLIERPAFMEKDKGLSPAEVGTVLHFVMQRLDLNSVATTEQIKNQVDNMVDRELLTLQQAKTVNIGKINTFFKSNLGKRMLKSKKIYREVPFNMQVSSKELYDHLDGELYKDEPVLLQGVIDCFFEEEEGFVLIDYKTDYIPSGLAESKEAITHLKERYKLQILYYAKVIEKLLTKRVKEKYIYLFSISSPIKFKL